MAFVLIKTYFLNCLLLYFHLNDDFALFSLRVEATNQPPNRQTNRTDILVLETLIYLANIHFLLPPKQTDILSNTKFCFLRPQKTLRLLNESKKNWNWNNTQLIHYFSQDWTNKTAQLLKLGITLLKLFFESG